MSLFSIFLVIALAIGLAVLQFRLMQQTKLTGNARKELQDRTTEFESAKKVIEEKSARLEEENRRLSKWKVIEDAQAKATEILSTSQAEADRVLGAAKNELESSKAQAEAIRSEARSAAKALKDEAERKLNDATYEARWHLDTAKKKAEEIAGAAYQALENADHYERTAKAMKNIVEGYGDQYIIPGHSFLDDMGEEYGHVDAGNKLKMAREKSKVMVKNRTAARCKYVEENRKDTAVNFVIDAFNGKVDSILSRVKSDNAGKLQQEIKDAFTLVNHNGKAFRDAEIREEYLAARLDELRWAVTVQQIKLEEKEEQRRIREQIREEEKARREFERAIKEAEKEEDALNKAMAKAKAQLETASDAQKEKYEKQIEELNERLRVAEEKSQRAISMAQQTRSGYVYIISNVGSFGESVYKIGLTRRLEPLDRVKELGDSSVPFEFDVHALIYSEDAPALETQLHRHFAASQVNKVNYRKEFFKADLAHIRSEVENLGLNAKWTMAALAREYRESMAVEKEISSDPKQYEAWLKRQFDYKPSLALDVEEVAEA